jgi:integrase
VSELMRKVGRHGVSLHSLRHSHATSLLSNGVPVTVVSEHPGARGPKHRLIDPLARVAGRYEGRGEDHERRHGGR